MAYLERRYNTYLLIHDLPRDVHVVFGKKRLVQSLGTSDKAAAKRRKAVIEAGWLAQIERARQGGKLHDDAAFYRDLLGRAASEGERQQVLSKVDSKSEALIFDAYQRTGNLLEWPGDPETREEPEIKAAVRFRNIATGKVVAFDEHAAEYLATLKNERKTVDVKATAIREFCKAFPTIPDVQRKSVQAWINRLAAEGKARGTIIRHLSDLRGYWRYLGSIEAVKENHEPFNKLSVADAAKESAQDKRRPFAPVDVVKLLQETRKDSGAPLADLIELAMYSGARIEELCSLKVDGITADSFKITDAKTSAGWREVPIHSKLAPTIARLVKASTDGYVLSGLPANKYGDRSNNIGLRFSRFKTALGFGSQHVFHSIRKTVATLFEQAGVLESVAADILGHEKTTMTYGLYSGGSSLAQKREAIERLKYEESTL